MQQQHAAFVGSIGTADVCKVVTVTTAYCCADTAHYLENNCMREAMENVLYASGVDVILNGHLHVYERTNPVYVSHWLHSIAAWLS